LHKRVICIVMAVGIVFGAGSKAFAEPSLNDQLNASKEQYSQSQAALNASSAKYAELENKIQDLDIKIQKSMVEAEQIKEKISTVQGNIAKEKKNLERAQQRVKDEQEMYKGRLRAMYISGNDGYLNALLDSEGISDFISKVDNIAKVAEFDNKLIASLNERQKEVESKKNLLEKNENQLLSLQNESNKNLADLGKQKVAQEPLVAQYKAEMAAATIASANAKAQVDTINNKIDEQKKAEEAAAQAAREAAQREAQNKAKAVQEASTQVAAATTPVINRGAQVSVPSVQTTTSSSRNSTSSTATNNSGDSKPSTGTSTSNSNVSSASSGSVVGYAQQFLGVPYVWGGTSPSGFDCSGFVQYVYAHVGVSIPRTSQAQFGAGTAVSQSNLQPGDLVFFHDDGSGPGHVGMYIGGGNIIHAPHTGDVVKIVPLSYMSGYCGARRVR